MSNIDLDLSSTQEWGGGFEPLPAGEYPVYVSGAEQLTGRASGDPYLKVVYTVTEGPYANRKLFDNFSLWSTRTQVPLQRFKSLRRALGLNPNVGGTTDELLEREFTVCVKVRERSDREGEKENAVSGYKPANGAAAPAYTAPAPKASAPRRASRPTPPPVAQGSEAAADVDAPW